MCLSKRSELRHIDPKAEIERGITVIALASQGADEFLRIKEF